jgi:hypothetical protein
MMLSVPRYVDTPKIMRKLRREEDLREFLATHFHDPFSIT